MKHNPPSLAYDVPQGFRALDCLGFKDMGVQVDKSRASATGVFAAASLDRGGDVINIAGIDTTNHQKNPVVFWNHCFDRSEDGNKPIGVCEDPETKEYTVKLYPDRGVAVATTFFSQKTILASQVAALVLEGTLRAQSIGYKETRVERIFEQDRYVGTHLIEIEMLETSWVGLPMNADAVRSTLSRDLCGKSLHPSIRAALQPYASAAVAWSNGVTLGGEKAMGRKTDDMSPAEEDGEQTREEPHGAKALRGLHKGYLCMKAFCRKMQDLNENSAVAKLVDSHMDALETCHQGVKEMWEDQYGSDFDPLNDEDTMSLDDDEEEVKDDDEMSDDEKAMFNRLEVVKSQLKHQLRLLKVQGR